MKNLSDINSWQNNLGLFSIQLNPQELADNYLMLNGGSGDFCIQPSQGEGDEKLFFEYSWSTDTKNFIRVTPDKIEIYNWFEKNVEKIERKKVEGNLQNFYKMIVNKSFKTRSDVAPFILDIFRQLRNLTFEKDQPIKALNNFRGCDSSSS